MTITLKGDVDMGTVPPLTATLDTAIGAVATGEATAIVVDMGAVEFLGSVGLSELVRTHRALLAHGAPLVTIASTPPTRRALTISGLHEYLTVVERAEDVAAAVHDWEPIAP